MRGILLLEESEMQKANKRIAYEGNSFIGNDDGMSDRLKILALRGEPRSKRTLINVCYSIVFLVLFAASYMFVILPAFWESPDVPVITEDFIWEQSKCGDVIRPDENFLVYNDDGTFSLYIDGQFVMNVNDTDELLNLLPIRSKDGN